MVGIEGNCYRSVDGVMDSEGLIALETDPITLSTRQKKWNTAEKVGRPSRSTFRSSNSPLKKRYFFFGEEGKNYRSFFFFYMGLFQTNEWRQKKRREGEGKKKGGGGWVGDSVRKSTYFSPSKDVIEFEKKELRRPPAVQQVNTRLQCSMFFYTSTSTSTWSSFNQFERTLHQWNNC